VIFHLGALGDLRELPVVERTEQVDAGREPQTGLHVALTGARTLDVLGRLRGRWVIPWRYLSPDQLAVLSALRAGRLGSPLRLVDPERPNLLHPNIATGGSEERSTDGWTATSGTLSWRQITDPPSGVLAHGAIEWVRSTTAAGDLAPGRVGATYRAPVLGGQQMRFSAFIRATAGTFDVAFGVDHFDATEAVTTAVGVPATVPTTWTEVSYTWTPGAGRVAAAPVWRIADLQAASTMQVTGAQAVYGATALPWREGGGSPVVLIESLPEDRPWAGEYHTTLTLVEV
jgi:hypothetical protein